MRIWIALTTTCVLVLGIFMPVGMADVDPPSPGYALLKNDLALVDGTCVGTVTAQYTFLAIDTPWGVRFDENSDCSVTPKIYEGPSTETFAYRVGGAAAQTNFFGPVVDMVVTHGVAVYWPVAQCPEAEPYWNHPQYGWATSPPVTSGTCLTTVHLHSYTTTGSPQKYAKSWFAERLDGGIDCTRDQQGMGSICTFDEGAAVEVPGWPDRLDLGEPSRVLENIGTAAHRIELIHE